MSKIVLKEAISSLLKKRNLELPSELEEYFLLLVETEEDSSVVSSFLQNTFDSLTEKQAKELTSEILKVPMTQSGGAQLKNEKLEKPLQMEEGESSIKPSQVFYENIGDTTELADYDMLYRKNACEIDQFLEATRVEDPIERAKALRNICPCSVKKNIPRVWDRIFELANDPHPEVRYNALHDLLDGSPNEMEDRVLQKVKEMQLDEDKRIKVKKKQNFLLSFQILIFFFFGKQKACNKVLHIYSRTGKWNVL